MARRKTGSGLRGSWLCAVLVWCALAVGLAATPVLAQAFPQLSGRVVDQAGVIPEPVRQKLVEKLAAHETKTSDQIVVATVRSLEGLTIEDYANRLYRHWQLGTKEKNNGALLLIAPNERKIRIEVGYGLEGALTDALSKSIIATAIAPKLRSGDFGSGIEAGVDAMLSIASRDAEEWQRRPELREVNDGIPQEVLIFLLFVVILFFFVMPMIGAARSGRSHRTRHGNWIIVPGPSPGWGSGSSSSGWGGGSDWSGGGGGFSGGGGSSGGGGASGDF